MALWPCSDFKYTGGCLSLHDNWTWLVNNWYTWFSFYNIGIKITALAGFQINRDARSTYPYSFQGLSPLFTTQSGAQRHVFGGYSHIGNNSRPVRWGFAWNNEGDWATDDVVNGIGEQTHSAGDTTLGGWGVGAGAIRQNDSMQCQLFGR